MTEVLVFALALLLSAAGGVFLVPVVLGMAPSRDRLRQRAASLLRGGLVIGVLERLAITASILLGYPAGIAVIVAIKGLGRYPELRGAAVVPPSTPGAQPSPDAAREAAELGAAVSERFIIGTLASLLWAVACATGALWLLR